MIDESELTWFLTQGVSVFERSTMGPMLDKLAADAHVSRPCAICESGIITSASKERSRLDWVARASVGDWCLKCNGTGFVAQRLSPEEQRLVDVGDWTSSGNDQRTAVPDAVLVRYAHVSRALSLMPTRLREALMMAYGDEGAELACTVHGRSWACSPLTAAGRAILRHERERKVRDEDIVPERPIQCMVAVARIKGHKKDPDRTKLLADAARDAEKLLRSAVIVWEQVVTLHPRRKRA